MRMILFFFVIALAVHAEVIVSESNGNVGMSNGNLSTALQKARNYGFNLSGKDKDGKGIGILMTSRIWYHGRSGNTRHFYQDQAENSWPVRKYELKGNSVRVFTGNMDFDVERSVTMFDDFPAVRLDYLLTTRESREFSRTNYPMLNLTKEITAISFDDGTLNTFATGGIPSDAELAASRALLLHMPAHGKTLLLMPDVNKPLEFGRKLGVSPFVRDVKWSKMVNLNHLYYPAMPYYREGEQFGVTIYFQLLDGAELSDAHKQAARELAEHFKLENARYDLSDIECEFKQPSALAGVLPGLPGIACWSESTLKRIYPNTVLPMAKHNALELECAAGEYESIQLAMLPEQAAELRSVILSPLSDERGNIISIEHFRAYLLEYQPIAHSRAALANVNRFADKMLPVAGTLPRKLVAGENNLLHLTFFAPPGTPGGLYRGKVMIDCDGKTIAVPVVLKVWNFELPAENPFTAYGLLWNSPQSDRLKTLRRLTECSFGGTTNSGGQRELAQYLKDGEVNFPDKLNIAEKAVKEYGMNAWQAPYAFLGAWDWRPGKRVRFLNLDPETPEFEEKFRAYFQSLHRQAVEKGILEQSFAYLWDEVTAPHYPLMHRTSKILREAAPGMRLMIVAAPDPEVIEANDIITTGSLAAWWGPEAEKIITEAKKSGKEFWVYLNAETFSTDVEAIVPRLTPWRCHVRGLSGYLQWSMDYNWQRGNFAADGHVWLLYPSREEPVTSVRLEYFRDGVEDYRYLELVKLLPREKRAELERKIIEIAPAYGSTSIDPVRLRDVRRQIGTALEQALSKP